MCSERNNNGSAVPKPAGRWTRDESDRDQGDRGRDDRGRDDRGRDDRGRDDRGRGRGGYDRDEGRGRFAILVCCFWVCLRKFAFFRDDRHDSRGGEGRGEGGRGEGRSQGRWDTSSRVSQSVSKLPLGFSFFCSGSFALAWLEG